MEISPNTQNNLKGSQNWIEERVSDLIWESPTGIKFEVEITEDGAEVKFCNLIKISPRYS